MWHGLTHVYLLVYLQVDFGGPQKPTQKSKVLGSFLFPLCHCLLHNPLFCCLSVCSVVLHNHPFTKIWLNTLLMMELRSSGEGNHFSIYPYFADSVWTYRRTVERWRCRICLRCLWTFLYILCSETWGFKLPILISEIKTTFEVGQCLILKRYIWTLWLEYCCNDLKMTQFHFKAHHYNLSCICLITYSKKSDRRQMMTTDTLMFLFIMKKLIDCYNSQSVSQSVSTCYVKTVLAL